MRFGDNVLQRRTQAENKIAKHCFGNCVGKSITLNLISTTAKKNARSNLLRNDST